MKQYGKILTLREMYRKETGKSTIAHPAEYINWLEDKLTGDSYPSAFIKWIEWETEFRHEDECWYCDDEKFETVEELYQHYLKDIEKYGTE